MTGIRHIARGMICLSLIPFFTGCTTYRSQQVSGYEKHKGVATNVDKTYLATVTWSSGATTQHVCTFPAIFAVDVVAAPLGTTNTEMDIDDGRLTKLNVELDQKIPEVITAVGDAAANIPGLDAGGSRTAKEEKLAFMPPLDDTDFDKLGYITSMSFSEF